MPLSSDMPFTNSKHLEAIQCQDGGFGLCCYYFLVFRLVLLFSHKTIYNRVCQRYVWHQYRVAF